MIESRLLKTKEDAIEFLTWVATLEAEILPKGKSKLQSEEGYCCLGIATCLTIPEEELETDDNKILYGEFPDDLHNPPLWLVKINGDFAYRHSKCATLSELNDGYLIREHSHKEIARLLLKAYEKELNELLS